MYIVRSSPSKKRRTLSHGPMKKSGGTGPYLLAAASSNNQHPALQHQVSTDTREDNEADNCKNWKYENGEFSRTGNSLCLLIATEIKSSSVSQHVKYFYHNKALIVLSFFTQLSSQVVLTSSQSPHHRAIPLNPPFSPPRETLNMFLQVSLCPTPWIWITHTAKTRSPAPPRGKRENYTWRLVF